MVPPHTMSPSKNARPCPGPLTKPVNCRSLNKARISTASYFQSVGIQAPMAASRVDTLA